MTPPRGYSSWLDFAMNADKNRLNLNYFDVVQDKGRAELNKLLMIAEAAELFKDSSEVADSAIDLDTLKLFEMKATIDKSVLFNRLEAFSAARNKEKQKGKVKR